MLILGNMEVFTTYIQSPHGKTMKATTLFLLCIFTSQPLFAEIFKWTGENGKVYFSDTKPRHLQSSEVKLKISTYKNVSYDKSLFNTGKKVVMYSTSWCAYCKKAKKYFKEQGIRFTEYDIEKNLMAKRRYKKMGAKGVPVILVGNARMNGFSEKGFERIYQ